MQFCQITRFKTQQMYKRSFRQNNIFRFTVYQKKICERIVLVTLDLEISRMCLKLSVRWSEENFIHDAIKTDRWMLREVTPKGKHLVRELLDKY